ncbi:putative peptidase; S54 family protein [Paratrimastix pyriformis]|uniref:rhomboid protease n=1 Tax=Paratrimastix pyriformis TaxID=342808 RepID=A0ABQ8UID1_9EUKA|nr:putative peptidase; S54 family protein [Paratrimastix pyriformis]
MGQPPAFNEPLIVRRHSTILDSCRGVHRTLQDSFKYALLSAKYSPQRVGRIFFFDGAQKKRKKFRNLQGLNLGGTSFWKRAQPRGQAVFTRLVNAIMDPQPLQFCNPGSFQAPQPQEYSYPVPFLPGAIPPPPPPPSIPLPPGFPCPPPPPRGMPPPRSRFESSNRFLHVPGEERPLLGSESSELPPVQPFVPPAPIRKPTPKKHWPFLMVTLSLADIIILIVVILQDGLESWSKNILFGPPLSAWAKWGARSISGVRAGAHWQWISPIVLHGGIIHLAFNLIFIMFVAFPMERDWSAVRMLPITVVAGVGGNLVSALLRPFQDMRAMSGGERLTLAASCPLAGILGAALPDVLKNWSMLVSPVRQLVFVILEIAVYIVVGLAPQQDNWLHIETARGNTTTSPLCIWYQSGSGSVGWVGGSAGGVVFGFFVGLVVAPCEGARRSTKNIICIVTGLVLRGDHARTVAWVTWVFMGPAYHPSQLVPRITIGLLTAGFALFYTGTSIPCEGWCWAVNPWCLSAFLPPHLPHHPPPLGRPPLGAHRAHLASSPALLSH